MLSSLYWTILCQSIRVIIMCPLVHSNAGLLTLRVKYASITSAKTVPNQWCKGEFPNVQIKKRMLYRNERKMKNGLKFCVALGLSENISECHCRIAFNGSSKVTFSTVKIVFLLNSEQILWAVLSSRAGVFLFTMTNSTKSHSVFYTTLIYLHTPAMNQLTGVCSYQKTMFYRIVLK